MNEYELYYGQRNAELREIAAHERLVTEALAARRIARQAARPQGVSGRAGVLRRLAAGSGWRAAHTERAAAGLSEC
ncbi:hypothetical protein P3T37_002565 [Kitasatospora sp. MAA4]|uniref:hypothetical protein n=1 Tax=Kitasatospora sp. MAA4 TaxID=3035093 RepID=UPI0024740934|nr:hypothetical protein [Kitasatospora sp. MAA4]MDH6133171.1 hypothetical protein [Kitasatospora sp. MAA4]